ncbi:hypothetical protein [Streptosporangium saharense]|uniref:Uncharacterized protein n=1 Tax=Streptosporangium saharense TaxID=1706840 RepID=A0A7W7QGU3_9ACTN|nr:hypothetical protein [Streptosporangium saharense]MBB4913340.1 hypothetical protein [Streptosporangium saharense]
MGHADHLPERVRARQVPHWAKGRAPWIGQRGTWASGPVEQRVHPVRAV